MAPAPGPGHVQTSERPGYRIARSIEPGVAAEKMHVHTRSLQPVELHGSDLDRNRIVGIRGVEFRENRVPIMLLLGQAGPVVRINPIIVRHVSLNV